MTSMTDGSGAVTSSRPTPPPIRKPVATAKQARPARAATTQSRPAPTSTARPSGQSAPSAGKPASPRGGRPSRGRSGGGKGGSRGRRPGGRGGRSSGIHFGPPRSKSIPNAKQPPRNPDAMYLLPIGGLEEIGRNCAAVEYKGDIVIIDAGLMFPTENMHGIDYIIPDISPLHGKEKSIKGVIITHAHYDHFGGVPHLLPKLGNPPVYGSEFTMKLVEKRQSDFPNYAKPKVHILNRKEVFRLGHFEIETFHVNHSVPNAFGVVVRTPAGSIAFTGDFKFDTHPVNDLPADEEHLKELGCERH